MVKRLPSYTKAWTQPNFFDFYSCMNKQVFIRRVAKPGVFTLSLVPLGWIIFLAVAGQLGANPVEAVNRSLGDWALRFLWLTLALSPLAALSGWGWPVRFRRMLGLFAFFYASLHIANYVIADQFFNWADIWTDIIKRQFITVGMLVFVGLFILAVTSPKSAVKKLGAKRWRKLHRLIYPAAIGTVLHYVMMIKADLMQPAIYAVLLAVLLGLRLYLRRIRPSFPTKH